MTRITRILTSGLIMMAGCTLAPPPPNLPPLTGRAVGLYPASARLRITMFYDFGCGECGDIFNSLMEIIPEYEGRVILVNRDYINPDINPGAYKSAIAARCAGEQSKYETYAAMVFSYHEDWLALSDEQIIAWASQIGLDLASFSACYGEKRPAEAIKSDMRDAKLLQVRRTPVLFMGQSEITNPGGKDEWRYVLDQALGDVTRQETEVD